jgi:hypothetical protein
MTAISFEWDMEKAALNRRKLRLSFEEARSVFFDGQAVRSVDGSHSTEEQRYPIRDISIVVTCCLRREEARGPRSPAPPGDGAEPEQGVGRPRARSSPPSAEAMPPDHVGRAGSKSQDDKRKDVPARSGGTSPAIGVNQRDGIDSCSPTSRIA